MALALLISLLAGLATSVGGLLVLGGRALQRSWLAVALALLAGTHGGWIGRDWILGLSLVLGAVRAFQMPAQQALIALLIPQRLLGHAIAMNASAMQAAIIGGPALGGALYVLGATAVYSASTVLLLVAGGLMLAVRYSQAPPPGQTSLRTVLAGVHFVWQNKILLGATTLDLFAVLLGGAAGTFVRGEHLSVPLTLEDTRKIGATLGSGVVLRAPDLPGNCAFYLEVRLHPPLRDGVPTETVNFRLLATYAETATPSGAGLSELGSGFLELTGYAQALKL